MSDRIQPEVADGEPIVGELVAVVDESTPSNSAGGITYVVSVSAIFDPTEAARAMGRLFLPGRIRPFHWAKEGPLARNRMMDEIAGLGVSSVAYFAHVGRTKQISARLEMLARAADHVGREGVDHLVIEASDERTVRLDNNVMLAYATKQDDAPYVYDWRSKHEPLLWIADAIAGAVGEYLVEKDPQWFDRLVRDRVVSLLQHP